MESVEPLQIRLEMSNIRLDSGELDVRFITRKGRLREMRALWYNTLGVFSQSFLGFDRLTYCRTDAFGLTSSDGGAHLLHRMSFGSFSYQLSNFAFNSLSDTSVHCFDSEGRGANIRESKPWMVRPSSTC